LDKYNIENEHSFHKDAATEIYNWLPPEKKIKLEIELFAEGIPGLESLDPLERFLRLMYFLEINFIKTVDWSQKIAHSTKSIQEIQIRKQKKPFNLELGEQKIEYIAEELQKSELKPVFEETLTSTGIYETYQRYLQKKKELSHE
jgi:hypothetical protein